MTHEAATYEERIERYRVCRREANMSDERKADMRLAGLDPEDTWSLIWSFADEADADRQLKAEEAMLAEGGYSHLYEYRVLDAGQAETITRQAWF